MTEPTERKGVGPFIVLGSAVLDLIHVDDTVHERAGGAALNVAVALRRLGVSSHLIGNVGTDDAGWTLRRILDREDVALSSTARRNSPTATVESRRHDGTVTYRFDTARPSGLLEVSDRHDHAIRHSAGVALSALRLDNPAALRRLTDALDAVRGPRLYDPNPRMRTSQDLDAHRREIDHLARHVDLLKFGRDDTDLLYDEDPTHTQRRFLSAGVRAVLITDSARGCSLATVDHELTAPTCDLPGDDVIDPMGAGDATVAAVAYCLLRHGWPTSTDEWRQTLTTAMTAAALTCRRHGAATATPRLRELGNLPPTP